MLNQKYPAPAPQPRNLVIALLFGLFIGFFLIFFEPFDIDLARGRHDVISLSFYGLITTCTIAFFSYLLPLLFPGWFSDKYWKVKHQMIYCLLILFVVATLNGLYTNYFNALEFSWSNYWWMINRTFVLGGIPFSFLILLDYQRKYYQHHGLAQNIQEFKKPEPALSSPQVWTITSDLKEETFSFQDQDFCYAQAAGNYIDLYKIEQGKLKYETIRLSLSAFEKQLAVPHLKRCHRSYLVNLKKVVQVSGNAQGLQLRMPEPAETVPVSRKYIPIIKAFFSESE